MEPLVRAKVGNALCALAFCLTGCVGTGSFLHLGAEQPVIEPCRVLAVWNPGVVFTPDPVHDGTPTAGLAGRIYTFGTEITYPMLGNGSLVVQLFDDSKSAVEKPTSPLEEWRFDPETLKHLQHHDPVGWGYTVFLPWASYKPEIMQVHLKVCYLPPKGFPIYAAGSPMTLVDPEQMNTLATGLAHASRKSGPDRKDSSTITTVSAQQKPQP
jgi:hypothetical protein